MSLLAPLRRTNVQITILAVVVGVQVSNVLSSVLHAVAQAIQFAFYPARLPGIDLVRALKSSLFLVVTQTLLSALVAAGTIWLLARLLASNSDSAE